MRGTLLEKKGRIGFENGPTFLHKSNETISKITLLDMEN